MILCSVKKLSLEDLPQVATGFHKLEIVSKFMPTLEEDLKWLPEMLPGEGLLENIILYQLIKNILEKVSDADASVLMSWEIMTW